MSTERFSGHAVVELIGHKILAGAIAEVTFGGSDLLQITPPDGPTQFVNPGLSVYRVTLCSEDVARAAARQYGERFLAFQRLEIPELADLAGIAVDIARLEVKRQSYQEELETAVQKASGLWDAFNDSEKALVSIRAELAGPGGTEAVTKRLKELETAVREARSLLTIDPVDF